MDLILFSVLVGLPLVAHLLLSAYAYLDAPRHGMDARRWGLLSLGVPLFGFFTYLFERDDRKPSDRDEMFTDGVFEVHESRADDSPFSGDDGDREGDERGRDL